MQINRTCGILCRQSSRSSAPKYSKPMGFHPKHNTRRANQVYRYSLFFFFREGIRKSSSFIWELATLLLEERCREATLFSRFFCCAGKFKPRQKGKGFVLKTWLYLNPLSTSLHIRKQTSCHLYFHVSPFWCGHTKRRGASCLPADSKNLAALHHPEQIKQNRLQQPPRPDDPVVEDWTGVFQTDMEI